MKKHIYARLRIGSFYVLAENLTKDDEKIFDKEDKRHLDSRRKKRNL